MTGANSSEARDWLEGRRLRAYALAQAGWQQQEIAEALGVSKGAVSQWMKRVREGGVTGLKRQPAPGAESKLSTEQLARLPEVLGRGAEAHGFRGDVWTYERIRTVIEREFGISYHVDHMNFILKKIGWSRQTPRKRAAQRNEEAVAEWQQDWPEVEKKPNHKSKR
jgi:transposase